MIKVICFDLDGVYFLNGKSNFIKALGELGVSEDEAKRVFLKSDEMNNRYKIGKMTDEEFCRKTYLFTRENPTESVNELRKLLL